MALATASALPLELSLMATTAPGSPLMREAVAYDSEPSSTRATSRMRTVDPSALALSTMSSNCRTLVSCPDTLMVAAMTCPGLPGASPSDPAEICRFCVRMALFTLSAERP